MGGALPVEVYKSRDYVLVYPNEKSLKDIKPDVKALRNVKMPVGGIAATALAGEKYSRFVEKCSTFEFERD